MSNPTTTSYSRGTEYVASFQKQLPFMVTIHQNFHMRFGMKNVQARDSIETGDNELDQMLTISGEDEKTILEWLKPTGSKKR